jgi:hypothetical protein
LVILPWLLPSIFLKHGRNGTDMTYGHNLIAVNVDAGSGRAGTR